MQVIKIYTKPNQQPSCWSQFNDLSLLLAYDFCLPYPPNLELFQTNAKLVLVISIKTHNHSFAWDLSINSLKKNNIWKIQNHLIKKLIQIEPLVIIILCGDSSFLSSQTSYYFLCLIILCILTFFFLKKRVSFYVF